METKICRKCGIEKSVDEYRLQKNRNGTYRYCSWCKQCDKEYTNNWKRQHEEEIYNKRKEYVANYNLEYWKKNGNEIMKKRNPYFSRRRKEDYIFKLKEQVRNLINISIKSKGHRKNTKTMNLVGCDLDYLIDYLLKTYKDNYGYDWDKKEPVHIDHIIPMATATTKEEVINLCHYTNLQLLKASDNLKKSDKMDWNLSTK